MEKKNKKEVIVIDTLTEIQANHYMTDRKSQNFDKWKNYAVDIWEHVEALRDRGFSLILVIGHPGSGKSSGMKTLDPAKTIWFNCDRKNPTWAGGFKQFGTTSNPKKGSHTTPKSYKEITDLLDLALKKDLFEEQRFAFLLAHVEEYKTSEESIKQRIKTLGAVTNNMLVSSKFEMIFFARSVFQNGEPSKTLETQSNGVHDAHTFEGLFPFEIKNDYAFIIEQIKKFRNEEEI